jgi:hypothetical protein
MKGGIVGFALMSGNYPETYTKAGNTWLFNGAPLPPRVVLKMSPGILVLKIDGADPYKFSGRYDNNGRSEYYCVPPGMHSVEVDYMREWENERGYTHSEGFVTFDQYFFEGSYLFTGTVEGKQVRFRAERQ